MADNYFSLEQLTMLKSEAFQGISSEHIGHPHKKILPHRALVKIFSHK